MSEYNFQIHYTVFADWNNETKKTSLWTSARSFAPPQEGHMYTFERNPTPSFIYDLLGMYTRLEH